jgi:hypothetical protein
LPLPFPALIGRRFIFLATCTKIHLVFTAISHFFISTAEVLHLLQTHILFPWHPSKAEAPLVVIVNTNFVLSFAAEFAFDVFNFFVLLLMPPLFPFVFIRVFIFMATFTRILTPTAFGLRFEFAFELVFELEFGIVPLESVPVVIAPRSSVAATTIALHSPIPVNSGRSSVPTPTFASVAIASSANTSSSFSHLFISRGEAAVAVAPAAFIVAAVAVINNGFAVAASIFAGNSRTKFMEESI